MNLSTFYFSNISQVLYNEKYVVSLIENGWQTIYLVKSYDQSFTILTLQIEKTFEKSHICWNPIPVYIFMKHFISFDIILLPIFSVCAKNFWQTSLKILDKLMTKPPLFTVLFRPMIFKLVLSRCVQKLPTMQRFCEF
jgi:hypothetical protein